MYYGMVANVYGTRNVRSHGGGKMERIRDVSEAQGILARTVKDVVTESLEGDISDVRR